MYKLYKLFFNKLSKNLPHSDISSGAGTDHPSGAPKFTPGV